MKLLEIFDRENKDDVARFMAMLEKFFPIAIQELNLDDLPNFSIHKSLGDPDYPSFGGYDFENNILYVAIANRHPVDILRTIAHELVHYSQNMDTGLTIEDGVTGSEKENQANSLAGIIIRRFNKAHPEYLNHSPLVVDRTHLDESIISENLRKWFKEKWVRFGPDGKIRGACARGSKAEGKPKCLPQSKAHALGKKGRASAASRKRRQDPNPERKGSAINVKTKESRQGVAEGFDGDEEYYGIIMNMIEGEDGFKLTARSPDGEKLGFVEFSYDTDGTIRAEELEVYEKHRGRGIAKIMYDYVKDQGFKIARSDEQTPAGAGFWDKHRPGKRIWEQGVAEGSYREGGSITHDGVEYDFDSVMSIAEKMPTKSCSVDKLSWVLEYDTPNKERLERADITVPLIVTKSSNGKLVAIDGLHRLAKAVRDNVKTLPVKYIKPSELESAKLNKQGVAEGKIIHTYLWHGSRQKIPMLEPRHAVDIGGAAGSNQNAIYATSDPIIATQLGMPAAGSDYGHFPNDPQMVLFSGKIRKGEYVYLHKLPFNGPDGKPQFVRGGNNKEFHSIPGVDGIKPIEIKEIPVNRYLHLIRKATPADLKLRKKYTNEQDVAEGQSTCPNCGGPAFTDKILAEKQDACYHKVRSRYKVWPSAYASGALVQCRKKGAANWGKKVKETQVSESPVSIDDLDQILSSIINEKWSTKYKRSINCKNPRGFSQRAHCQGRKKHNEDTELSERKSKRKSDRFYYGPVYYGWFGSTETTPTEVEISEADDSNNQYVYRIDSKYISDFEKNLQTYYHNKDFSMSGQFPAGMEIPKEYTGKIKGVYAGSLFHVAPYAVGNANTNRYVAVYSPGKPTLYFAKSDVSKFQNNISYLTVFDADNFEKLPTHEYFSDKPGVPVKQEKISNPFEFIKSAGWNIKIVDDLESVLSAIKKQKDQGKDITYGAEGLNENFADGKVSGKSRPGRARRAGVSCKASVTDLRRRAKSSTGEKAKMYHWCGNMKAGKKS